MDHFQIILVITFSVLVVNINGQVGRNSLQQRYFDLFVSSPYDSGQSGQGRPPPVPPGFERYNLSSISEKCPKDSFYASYNPSHRTAVSSLTQFYMDQPDFNSLLTLAEFFKRSPDVHPKVWYTSFVRALVQRTPNSLDLDRPSPIELFPTAFFPASLLRQNTTRQECVFLDERFGADNGIENRLWYFREDLQMNGHHWIWHLLYPVNSTEGIDRRGEFFYFFHHELVARYEAERLSNDFQQTVALDIQVDTVLEEGYKPHLSDGISSSQWAERQPFRRLSEVLNATLQQELLNVTISRDRVLEAIQRAVVVKDGRLVDIRGEDHIDLLGELSEASNQSVNPTHYGMDGFHNQAHWVIANVDTNTAPGIEGVMGDASTAMRDIIFYRWHKYVDLIFQSYKSTHLIPYAPYGGELPLVFRGIRVDSVRVVPEGVQGNRVNFLQTFWNMRRFNLDGGLDFNTRNTSRRTSVNICAKHLDHQEFQYQMQIDNSYQSPALSTVRIFLAPRFKSERQNTRFTMSEQRTMFFTLDSFQTVLQPGRNSLIRRSMDSTLTAQWPKSFEELREEINSGVKRRIVCDCGYPHHLLLPKGTPRGITYDLFVMVTNGLEDQVQDTSPTRQEDHYVNDNEKCQPSHIHCGVHGKKYPDSKPMGYPFDRRPYSKPQAVRYPSGHQVMENREVAYIEDYVQEIPNMHLSQVMIQHVDQIFGLQGYNEV